MGDLFTIRFWMNECVLIDVYLLMTCRAQDVSCEIERRTPV